MTNRLHTLESHEAEMPNCSDPDCEFHHPEVREYLSRTSDDEGVAAYLAEVTNPERS